MPGEEILPHLTVESVASLLQHSTRLPQPQLPAAPPIVDDAISRTYRSFPQHKHTAVLPNPQDLPAVAALPARDTSAQSLPPSLTVSPLSLPHHQYHQQPEQHDGHQEHAVETNGKGELSATSATSDIANMCDDSPYDTPPMPYSSITYSADLSTSSRVHLNNSNDDVSAPASATAER